MFYDKEKIQRIENALRLRQEYTGKFRDDNRYLNEMDALACNEIKSTKSQRLSHMLAKYFVQVRVKDFKGAIARLKQIDNK